jgi:hypothetical protein
MKKIVAALLLISSQILTLVGAEETGWRNSATATTGASPCSNLPDWVTRVAQSAQLPKRYDVNPHLNPFFQSGDFNGDGKLDVALLVRNKTTRQTGIAIFLYGGAKPVVLGAGNSFRNGGADFNWMDNWSVYPKQEVHKSHWENKPPSPKGDALWVAKSESASAFIFWDGKQFVWYQQSD